MRSLRRQLECGAISVEKPSQAYVAMQTRWQQMRDCVAGSKAIKAATVTYLPALAGHKEGHTLSEDYRAYQARALFYGATGRTIDGLNGMIFRQPPIVRMPAAAKDLLRDVDLMGRRIEDFCDAVTREVMTIGRVGLLVDHTAPPFEFEDGQQRPYLVLYTAEQILDVVYQKGGSNPRELVQVRLYEVTEEPLADDEFDTRTVERIRVLELVEGVYRQRVFQRAEPPTKVPFGAGATSSFELVEVITPTGEDGRGFDTIPFWLVGTGSTLVPGEIEPPPLLDLSDVNLCHYRQDADYRNALHMAGVPTPYCTGMADPGEPVHVGASQFLWFAPPEARVGFLSYGADGVSAIQMALNDLEQQMAFLGARMLQPDKRGVESAETARIYRMGEISVLARMAGVASAAITRAMRFMLDWAGIPMTDEHLVKLNDDFLPAQAPPQLVAEMMKAWQAGAISHDSLWSFMQVGELVDTRRTIEEEQALIEAEQPELEAEAEQLTVEAQRLGVQQQQQALEAPTPPEAQQRAA